jgi:4-diphosphocytidyl-2-C-methyl-D-erythritol kinase
MTVAVFAPAKINLSLRVAPPRADGRHPLQSIVAFADVGDRLILEEGRMSLKVRGPFAKALDTDGDNLIERALASLGVGAKVTLEKNLPVASGIGGGSADAAAALRGANMLYDLRLTDDELERHAAEIGADVPVCVRSVSVFMEGQGERLTPIDLPELVVILANPGVPLPTRDVFARYDAMQLGEALTGMAPAGWADAESLRVALREMHNDLEAPACDLRSEIAQVLARLGRCGGVTGPVRMSGSGATCFAVAKDWESAEPSAYVMGLENPRWWVRAARLGIVDAAPRRV